MNVLLFFEISLHALREIIEISFRNIQPNFR